MGLGSLCLCISEKILQELAFFFFFFKCWKTTNVPWEIPFLLSSVLSWRVAWWQCSGIAFSESKSENCYLSENHISIPQPLIITYKSVHFQFSMTSCTCCCHRNCQLTQLVFSLQLRTSFDCEALVKEKKAESLNRESDHPGCGLLPTFTSHLPAHASPNNTISSLGLSWWKLSSAT